MGEGGRREREVGKGGKRERERESKLHLYIHDFTSSQNTVIICISVNKHNVTYRQATCSGLSPSLFTELTSTFRFSIRALAIEIQFFLYDE